MRPRPSRRCSVLCLVLASGPLAGQHDELVRLEPLRSFPLDGGTTMAAAFAPDGTALATGSELGDLRVLDLPALEQRWLATPSDHWIGTIVFAPDGRRLACLGRHLTLHDAADGRELARWPDAGPHGFAWHPDGVRFAFARVGEVLVVDGTSAAPLASFDYPVNTLAFASDGALFAGDNVGRLWRVPPGGGAPELRFDHRRGADDSVRAIAVACAGGSVFDATSRELRRDESTFDVPGSPFDFAVTADGQSFAVGGARARVRWWIDGGAVSRDVDVPGNVAALAFHPDGRTLFVSTYDGHQALYADEANPVAVPAHAARVRDFAMSPDGTAMAVRARTWSLQPANGSPPRALPAALDVVAGRHGPELLVREESRVVAIDGRTGVELTAIASPVGWLTPASAGPGDLLLVGRELVEPTTRAVVELPGILMICRGIDVARGRDGMWAAGAAGGIEGEAGALLVTDARGKALLTYDDGPVYTVAFSPDGRRLVYGCGHGLSAGGIL